MEGAGPGSRKGSQGQSPWKAVILSEDPPPPLGEEPRLGEGVPTRQTSTKIQPGHSPCVLVPRPSQKESLEGLGLCVWKARWQPAHLQRHAETFGCRFKQPSFPFFLSLPDLHLPFRKKYFNVHANIPQLQSGHLSPLAAGQRARSPSAPGRRSRAEEAVQRGFGRQPSSGGRPIKSTILDSRGGHVLVEY